MTLDEKKNYIHTSFYNLRTRGVVKTWSDFAELAGINRGTLSMAKNGNEHYLTDSLMFRIRDFVEKNLGGNINVNGSSNNIATGGSTINTATPQPDGPVGAADDLVPVIPYKLYKDPDTSVMEYLEQGHSDIQMAQAVEQFGNITCYKFCNSDAMYPDIRPGDLLALRAVDRDAPIVNGETYVLDVQGVGLMMRIVDDISDTEVLLTAKNGDKYGTMTLPKGKIITLFRIIGYMRTNI